MILTAWTAAVGDAVLATAFVLYCASGDGYVKGADKTVDPHVAHVLWDDGKMEDISATNGGQCDKIQGLVDMGVMCSAVGDKCGWQPTGREGIRVLAIRCERTARIPGGACIKGYNC